MPPPTSTIFPYTTLFRSATERRTAPVSASRRLAKGAVARAGGRWQRPIAARKGGAVHGRDHTRPPSPPGGPPPGSTPWSSGPADRKSTRLNSSHLGISYAATDIDDLSLHDALPICDGETHRPGVGLEAAREGRRRTGRGSVATPDSSEEGRRCPRPGSHPAAVASGRTPSGLDPMVLRPCRSEEHTSELQSLRHLVCRHRHRRSFPTRRSSDLRRRDAPPRCRPRGGSRRAPSHGPGVGGNAR